jgi:hypothetical protein
MGVAVPNRETVRKARQPPRYPIYVARDTLFEARYINLPASNGDRVALGIIVWMLEFDLCGTRTVSLSLRKMFFAETQGAGESLLLT